MVASKSLVVPFSSAAAASGPVSLIEIEQSLTTAEQRFVEAAQQAAPLSYQLQLAREVVALRMLRLVGQGAVMETADLTEAVTEEMARTGLYTQVIIDGLRGKVPDAVADKIAEVQGAFLEGASLIHAVATGAILDRVQNFKAPASAIRKRDVAYSVLFDKVPRKLTDGGR